MKIVSAAVECPTCGVAPGEFCIEDGAELLREHPDRILHDVVEINLVISKSTAYRIAQMLNADEDEGDEGFLYELMCVDIDIGRAVTHPKYDDDVAAG